MKIYSVSTRHYYAFGALVSEELSYKIKGKYSLVILLHFSFSISVDFMDFFKLQSCLEFVGSFLIHTWMSRTKTMEVRAF